jgi:hypothetical protein
MTDTDDDGPNDSGPNDGGQGVLEPVDGNAIGGLLIEVFGTEMTHVIGTCASCGTTGPVAGFVVYLGGPGTVARCRTCGSQLMVFVRKGHITSVDLRGLAQLG